MVRRETSGAVEGDFVASMYILASIRASIKDNCMLILYHGHLYKERRTCGCGFNTFSQKCISTHKKSCKLIQSEQSSGEKERIASLEKDKYDLKQQLHAKDEHYQKELAAKDRQIEELIKASKKPRTVNNTTNRYVVEQNVNVFGKETMKHTPQSRFNGCWRIRRAAWLLVKLKHAGTIQFERPLSQCEQGDLPGGRGRGEEKEWENRRRAVLEMLRDDNSIILEEAVEDEHMLLLDHQDMVRASAAANAADGGRCYKQQLDKIHNVIIN